MVLDMITNATTLAVLTTVAVAASGAVALAQDSVAARRAGTGANALPLQTTRTVSFTTTEGTWMSLDVSPDGSTIIFDLLGDLYTLPIAGGKATRITSGPAMDNQPRYSPDGKHIVFTSDRGGGEQVWVADPDGRNARARPQWFRDDQYVFRQMAEQARKILDAGGRVGLGGHGQMQGLGVHWELWSLAAGGIKPLDVIRIGAQLSADGIGLGKELGSLEPGKLADLQVLDANPLDDIRNTNTIRYVMKNGRLYDGATLDEVWPRAKAAEQGWWLRETATPRPR